MKVKLNKKPNNMNEQSINSLKDFRQKQISTNIKYHKIFILLLIIIITGLSVFIIFYKNKINSLKLKNTSYHSQLNLADKSISNKNNILMHKLVNIDSLHKYGFPLRYSFIFETSDEFNTIKNIIYDYIKEVLKLDVPFVSRNVFLLYQGLTDEDESFMDKISYHWNLAIFIETSDKKKFGIFFVDLISPKQKNKHQEFESNNTLIFLYSFETKKKYNYIGNGKKVFRLNMDGKMINIGDDEIIIYQDYFQNGGEINFPLKSFDLSTINNNVFTGKNGKFDIQNIEVFFFAQF